MTRIFLIPATLALVSLGGLTIALLGGDSWWPAAWIGGVAPLLTVIRSLWVAIRARSALT